MTLLNSIGYEIFSVLAIIILSGALAYAVSDLWDRESARILGDWDPATPLTQLRPTIILCIGSICVYFTMLKVDNLVVLNIVLIIYALYIVLYSLGALCVLI